jgi:hypothetical protein
MEKIKRVTFFGHSQASPEDKEYQDAVESARLLAQEGITIVNGGGPGIMKASSEGAQKAGGQAIGVTFETEGMTFFEGQDSSNPLTEKIVEPDYWQRTQKLWDLGDVYVFFNGGTGTISEFGMAWGLARLYFGHHNPLILFGSWWHDITEAFGQNMKLREEELQVYEIVNTPQQLLEEIKELDSQ